MDEIKQALVAIKCLVYNHEPYLRDCLEGFVMQQTNFPFVAIVHDDASTDGSAGIIRKYTEKYPHIFKPIYETQNQYSKHDGTLYKIMNEAIDATGAKYVAMCEGDDYWTDPLKLQKQVDFLEANLEYSMCCNATKWLFSDNRIYDNFCNGHMIDDDLSTSEIIEGGGLYINLVSVIYRNVDFLDKYRKSNWWSRADVGDYPLCIALSLIGKIRYMSDVMCVYRFQHPGSWTDCNKKVNIKHLWNEITWLQILDDETEYKYQGNIRRHLFKFWRNLYRENQLTTRQYVYKYKEAGKLIPLTRLIKDIVRHFILLVK